jgi:hypothetical protein
MIYLAITWLAAPAVISSQIWGFLPPTQHVQQAFLLIKAQTVRRHNCIRHIPGNHRVVDGLSHKFQAAGVIVYDLAAA